MHEPSRRSSVRRLPGLTLCGSSDTIDPTFMPHQCLVRYMEENGLTALLAIKRLAGTTPGVSWGECVTHMPLPNRNKVAHSGFQT